MQTIDKISHIEREIHAAKTNIRTLKAEKWRKENYQQEKTNEIRALIQLKEQQLHSYRKELAKLIHLYYNLS